MTATQDAPAAVDVGVGRTAWRQAASAGSAVMAFGFVVITRWPAKSSLPWW